MTSVQAIMSILKEQLDSYRTLLDLLHRERECLINIDAEKVEELSKEKDTIVMRLRLLEEERIRLAKKIAEDYGIAGDITLHDLWVLTKDDTFVAMRSQMLSLLQSIEEMNEFNRILTDRSISYIRTTANFFRLFASDNAKTKGTLLSMET